MSNFYIGDVIKFRNHYNHLFVIKSYPDDFIHSLVLRGSPWLGGIFMKNAVKYE